MGILATDEKQLIFIYSEDSRLGKEVLSYVNAINKPKRIININNEAITKTIWLEITAMLNTELSDLFNFNFASKAVIEGHEEFSSKDWLKVIEHNPSLLQHPIIIQGKDVSVLKQSLDVYEFFEATGSNFDKSKEAIKTSNHKDSVERNMTNKK